MTMVETRLTQRPRVQTFRGLDATAAEGARSAGSRRHATSLQHARHRRHRQRRRRIGNVVCQAAAAATAKRASRGDTPRPSATDESRAVETFVVVGCGECCRWPQRRLPPSSVHLFGNGCGHSRARLDPTASAHREHAKFIGALLRLAAVMRASSPPPKNCEPPSRRATRAPPSTSIFSLAVGRSSPAALLFDVSRASLAACRRPDA